MADRDIYKMLNDLVNRVELLENQLIKQKRENANLLEELEAKSSSGVSSSFVGAVDKKFSEILQTEDKIQSTVADLSDDTRKKFSKVEQTAEGISMEVSTFYNTISEVDYNPQTYPEKYESYKGSMISWNGNNYYFSNTLNKWVVTEENSVSSSFVQSDDGFTLNGDIVINGNTYQNGKIVSSSLYTTGQGASGGSAIYVCDDDFNKVAGFISFDTTGSGNHEAENRMLIAAEMGNALKILTYASSENQSSENVSIGAGMWRGPNATNEYSGFGYVYVSSPIVFTHFNVKNNNAYDVTFQDGCTVDFTKATVTGLYAVFE